MSAHASRATRALRRLGEDDPALGALALWCRHVDAAAPAGDAPAAWTEGGTIHYGPAFEILPLHEQAGLAGHHVLHVAFRHAGRAAALRARLGAGFDPSLYNLAADAILNAALTLAGHALPRPCPMLDELLAEALGEAARPADAIAAWDAEALYVRLAAQGGGTGRTGARRARAAEGEGEAAARAAAYGAEACFADDLRPAPDDAPAEQAAGGPADEAEWRQRLARAIEAGRAAGTGIGALAPLFAELRPPPTPWEVVLRRLVTRAVTDRPRPAPLRPSRRWLARDAAARAMGAAGPPFEPGAARLGERPRIAVCIDCSASIDASRLALFAAEVAGIGRRTGAEIHLLAFDVAVRLRRRLTGAAWESEIRAIPFARGGGTSFRAVIPEAAALKPSVIVVLTDLDGPFGPAPPRVPVLWAVPGEPSPSPPFGRVLSLAR